MDEVDKEDLFDELIDVDHERTNRDRIIISGYILFMSFFIYLTIIGAVGLFLFIIIGAISSWYVKSIFGNKYRKVKMLQKRKRKRRW